MMIFEIYKYFLPQRDDNRKVRQILISNFSSPFARGELSYSYSGKNLQ